MNEDQKIKAFLNDLSGAVIAAVRSGTAEDRSRLIKTLRDMDAGMPGVSEDALQTKEFLLALVSLLEGDPVGADALSGPYQALYAKIIEKAVMPERRPQKGPQKSSGGETREFLTQLSAAAVLAMQKGSPEERKALSGKLLEIRDGISGDEGARQFVAALSGMLDGSPPAPATLPAPYSGFFGKVLAAAKEKK